jgi:hypothetical protein
MEHYIQNQALKKNNTPDAHQHASDISGLHRTPT